MTTNPRVLRVTDPESLLAGVPYLLGFGPDDDLVVVVTTADTSRIVLTMRLDLPPGSADAPDVDREQAVHASVAAIVPPLRRLAPARAFVVLYPRRDPAAEGDRGSADGRLRPDQHDDLIDALGEALHEAGVDVPDVLVVAGDRWWSRTCEEPGCCPPDGRPLDTSGAWAVRAELVGSGLAPMRSRRDVERLVAAAGRDRHDALRAQVDAVRAELTAGDLVVDDLVPTVLDLVDLGPEVLDADDRMIAEALVALDDVGTRDLLMAGLMLPLPPEAAGEPLLRESAWQAFAGLTRVAPPGLVAPVATVTAALAYVDGRGALAWAAHDRAVADDGEYSLAALMASVISAGMPPTTVRECFAAAMRERVAG